MKKKLVILLAGLLPSATLFAQNDLTYTQVVDSIFSPVSKSQITTGILYDRVMPFAGLHLPKGFQPSKGWKPCTTACRLLTSSCLRYKKIYFTRYVNFVFEAEIMKKYY